MKLTKAKFAVVERLMEEIGAAVSIAVTLHNALLEKGINAVTVKPTSYNLSYEMHRKQMWHDGDITSVNDVYVSVKWDEYARSCHVDGGTCRIPVEALCEATRTIAIENIVAGKVAAYAKGTAEQVKRERDAKVRELERLKRELGDV